MNPIWMLARGSGVAAYLLLSGATIWGLLLASKVLDRSASARDLTWVHESLSLAAVAATLVHMVSLWLEEFIDFDLRHLLIPGASTFRPVPVALGVVAFWALAVITPSFYLRHRIGQRAWRTLHFATFGCFLAAAIHGITAGTDTGQPVMVVMYATTLTAVIGLIVLRVVKIRGLDRRGGWPRPRPRPGRSDPRRRGPGQEPHPTRTARANPRQTRHGARRAGRDHRCRRAARQTTHTARTARTVARPGRQ